MCSSCASSAYRSDTAGVFGDWCFVHDEWISTRSKYSPRILLAFARSIIRSLAVQKASPGGSASAFCEPGEHVVQVPRGALDRRRGHARHRVDHHDRVTGRVRDLRQLLDRVEHAGRRLRVHDGHDVVVISLERVGEHVRHVRAPELDFELVAGDAGVHRRLVEALAERAVDEAEQLRSSPRCARRLPSGRWPTTSP